MTTALLDEPAKLFLQSLGCEAERLDETAMWAFWLAETEGNSLLMSLADFRAKLKLVLRHGAASRRRGDLLGIRYCARALEFVEPWISERETCGEMLVRLNAALAHLILDAAAVKADRGDWDSAFRDCAAAEDLIGRIRHAHLIYGAVEKVTAFLPGKLITLMAELKCRAWLMGRDEYLTAVQYPVAMFGALQALPAEGHELSGKLAALQVAKLCSLAQPELFESALFMLRERFGVSVRAAEESWRLFYDNREIDRSGQLCDYIYLDLELFRGVVNGSLNRDDLSILFDLRDKSLPLFYGADTDLSAIRSSHRRELPYMYARCDDEPRQAALC